MRKTILIMFGIFSTFAVSAQADVSASVTDHYKTVIDRDPYSVEVCYDVTTSGDKSGDMLKGAIIGGVIGNNVGNIDNGGALGAVIGGLLGHNNSKATGGTQRQRRVETRYNEISKRVYSHSIATFWYEGKHHRVRFHK